MGWKGLIRDTIMFIVGFQLLLGVGMDSFRLGLILVVTATLFTIYAWYRYLRR